MPESGTYKADLPTAFGSISLSSFESNIFRSFNPFFSPLILSCNNFLASLLLVASTIFPQTS